MATGTKTMLGRPRTFDEDAVLDELVGLFWRQGYSQTSMTDIVEASGVHRPSLYRIFGTKEEIFATVLRRYLTERNAMLAGIIADCRPGIDGVHDFLDRFEADSLTDVGRYGCLLVNSSTELSGTAPGFENFADAHRHEMRHLLRTLVERAQPATDDVVVERTDLLHTLLVGFRVTTRSSMDPAEGRRTMRAIHSAVDAWQS